LLAFAVSRAAAVTSQRLLMRDAWITTPLRSTPRRWTEPSRMPKPQPFAGRLHRQDVLVILTEDGGAVSSSSEQRVAAGTQIGPYRIESTLGAGGMGQVYRAVDTRLNRYVALKIAREEFDERFEREARAIAQLNHPHICTLYDVGPNYIVMEVVEGETFATLLARGALPLDRVIRYGVQMADALAAAHAKGIIHRDLKPGNVMLTKSGVKVLDFGLAKTETDQTITHTQVVLGTPAYMAPEQREGRTADARTDIYALGLVLREMATGKKSEDLPGLPAQFVHVVRRCLETDPSQRWQTAIDVEKELDWTAASLSAAPAVARQSSSRLAWGVAALTSVAAIAVGALYFTRESAPTVPPTQFTLVLDKEISGYDLATLPVPSPTGELLAFSGVGSDGGTALWVRELQSLEARRLSGTSGASRIAWSPEGKWIAFFADGKLKKVSPYGGPPQTIGTVDGFQDAAWGSGGDIIFRSSNRTPLYRIHESGGAVQPLTTLNASLTENSHRFPEFLPGGRSFWFVSRCAERANNALYIGSLDSPEVTRVMAAQARVSYVAASARGPEMLVYYKDGVLVAQRFSLADRRFIGEATTLLDQLGYSAPSIEARFRVSSDGRVVVAQSGEPSRARLLWIHRSGEQVGELGGVAEYSQPRLSPRGDRVAFQLPDPQTGNRDLWFIEIARGIMSRLTIHVANESNPVWSPDGRQLLFNSDRDGGTEMFPYLKTSMDPGSGESRQVSRHAVTHDWTANGRWIVYEDTGDLIVGQAGGEPFNFLRTPASESYPRFSPDGKWIAYVSNESGRREVFVRPFAGEPAGPGGKLRVSHNGAVQAVWGPLGREIFYVSGDGSVFAVDTRNLGRAETLPTPVRLFRSCLTSVELQAGAWFDTQDGNRFLMACRVDPPGRFTVLMNWPVPSAP
jgi:eukaryotic-like serine/threonine-protein kinase